MVQSEALGAKEALCTGEGEGGQLGFLEGEHLYMGCAALCLRGNQRPSSPSGPGSAEGSRPQSPSYWGFRAYEGLRERFRLGQVDGEQCQAQNGLTMGCPASPDLLNILKEPFHRWAAGQGLAVPVMDDADDLGLAAEACADLIALVQGYIDWCALLHLKVHVEKTRIWSLRNPGGTTFTLPLRNGPLTLVTRFTFRGLAYTSHREELSSHHGSLLVGLSTIWSSEHFLRTNFGP